MRIEKLDRTFIPHSPLSSRFILTKNVALFAAALMTAPPTVSSHREQDVTLTSFTEQAERDAPALCGTSEIRERLSSEEMALLRRMRLGEATILDAPAVTDNSQLASNVHTVNVLVTQREGESARTRSEMVIAVTRRLADLEIEATPESVATTVQEVYSARERFRNHPILSGTVIFASGAVTENRRSGQSVYISGRVQRRLENMPGVTSVEYYHGILPEMQDCAWSTRESLEHARSETLSAIENTEGRISVLFRMHGGRNILEYGKLFASNEREQTESVTLRARDLAEAFAARYADPRKAEEAARSPEVVIFDSCLTYPLALRAFRDELRRIGNERGVVFPLPLVIVAGEDGQSTWRGSLMNRTLLNNSERVPTVSRLYPDGDMLGGEWFRRGESSNAVVLAPDDHGGYIHIA